MIFDPPSASTPAQAPPLVSSVNLAGMLHACAAEAGRLAQSLSDFDHAVGAVLSAKTPPVSSSPTMQLGPMLQEVDLLRQEAAGLAGLLDLIAKDSLPPQMLDAGALAGAIRLQSQRHRLFVAATCAMAARGGIDPKPAIGPTAQHSQNNIANPPDRQGPGQSITAGQVDGRRHDPVLTIGVDIPGHDC